MVLPTIVEKSVPQRIPRIIVIRAETMLQSAAEAALEEAASLLLGLGPRLSPSTPIPQALSS